MRWPGPRTVLWAAIAGAAVSVVLAAAPLPRRLVGESDVAPPPPLTAQVAPDHAPSLDPILALAPFGSLPGAQAPSSSPETSVGLTLQGVLITGDAASASAILSRPGEAARVFVVGDSVSDEVVLEAVLSDHVTLRVDGNVETLSFPLPEASSAAAAMPEDEAVVATLRARMANAPVETTDAEEPK